MQSAAAEPDEPSGEAETSKEPAPAQDKDKDKEAGKKKSIPEIAASCEEFPGLFRILRDRENGKVFLYIQKTQLEREFIYFSHTVDGVTGAGRNRGRYGEELIFRMARRFDRLEFIRQNTAFYFDPEHPLARAAKANTSHAVLAAEKIIDEDENGLLIPAENLFLKESLLQVKPSARDEKKALLGKLSDAKTKFARIHNYPKNSALVVEYVYDTPAPPVTEDDEENEAPEEDLADRRYISITMQHTLMEVPENDYRPRFDDPRVGFFTTRITDQTSTEATPWRDVIHRWDLRKKDPAAALSEPVEPIVWWMENTTPLEFRDTIRDAVLRWNIAFEKIGFKNALVVQQQSDDADWDAGDIRYNVLRWTSSPIPPFGGYGPSFVNPRTGQILGADIMLEFAFVKNRIFARRLWSEVGLAGETAADNQLGHDPRCCEAAHLLQQGVHLGTHMLRLRHADKVEMEDLIKEALTFLILHEIGHTLGLTHNFKASHLHDPAALQDRHLTEKTGLVGSVMDYVPLNLGPDKDKQGQYYITRPGPYDEWAVNYGYSLPAADGDAEKNRLASIAGRSHEKELAYGNDADDMRKPGKGIDPRAMIGDLSSDPIAYGAGRCELMQATGGRLLTVYETDGASWQELTNAYLTLTREQGDALAAISRYIGGVYVERALAGQTAPAPLPLRPVERDKQQAAMQALARFAFAPQAWTGSETLFSHLQKQRRGFDFFLTAEDPRLHERVLKIQRGLLDHLLHANTQNRILDSALYGNAYPLGEMMRDLTAAIMTGEPPQKPVNTLRQNLQLAYVDRLLDIIKKGSHHQAARSVALYQLQNIRQLAAGRREQPVLAADQPHFAHLLFKIQQGLHPHTP